MGDTRGGLALDAEWGAAVGAAAEEDSTVRQMLDYVPI